jgi:hypothetical protein
VRDLTSLLQVSAEYVRDVTHAFNERGSTRWTQIELGAPADWGITAFAMWSLGQAAAASD